MGIIQVTGPGTGRSYSVNISGDTPTETEQARINQYVAQQEARYSSFMQRYEQDEPEEVPEEEQADEEKAGFLSAVGLGIDQLQKSYGSAIEGLGEATGIEGLKNYGNSVIDANEKQIAETARKLTQQEDIDTFGEAKDFFFETLGQQVPQLGVSLSGAAAGAAAAAPIPIPGARILGATIGGVLANVPYFYGDNREAQKEAIDRGLRSEMSEGAAILTAIPQATLDSIVDRLLIGKVFNPKAVGAGGILTRAVKGTGVGSVAEVPTEIGQEVLNRLQAGLPINDDEAHDAYAKVAVAAAITGGTVRGATNVLAGDTRETEEQQKFRQLAEDQEEEVARLAPDIERLKSEQLVREAATPSETLALPSPESIQETTTEVEVEGDVEGSGTDPQSEALMLAQAARETTLPYNPVPLNTLDVTEREAIRRTRSARATQNIDTNLPPSEYRQLSSQAINTPEVQSADATLEEIRITLGDDVAAREAAKQKPVTGGDARYQPVDNKLFTQDQYNKAVEAIKAKRRYTLPTISSAIRSKDFPKVPLSTSRAIRDEMVNRGVIKRDDSSKTGYTVNPDIEALSDEIASYNKTLSETEKQIEKLKFDRVGALEQARRAQQDTTLDAKERNSRVSGFNKLADDLEGQISKAQRARAEIKDRYEGGPTNKIPTAETPKAVRSSEISFDQEKANEAHVISKKAEEAPRSERFNAAQTRVIGALENRLKDLGLADVQLVAKRLIEPQRLTEDGQYIEGSFQNKDGNRIIALSMELPDRSQMESPDAQFEAIKGVLNHEVVHALKNLGLFKDAEFSTLANAARKRKYVHIKNGKPSTRKYTYFERAEAMYKPMGLNKAAIEEEAIAEMFRDYADGKIELIGKPRNLFRRILNFLFGVKDASRDAGFAGVSDIFDGIKSGEIGKRERIAPTEKADPDQGDVEQESIKFSTKAFFPKLNMAPEGSRAHKLPHQLLVQGTGARPSVKITQSYTPENAAANNSSIEQIIERHPDAMMSEENWMEAMQDALGGDFLPAPPLVGIEYSRSPERMAEKLQQLTPELRKGVDEGFEYVDQIRKIYESGEAQPRMTMDLFVWGILSRGAGPVQQESAFIDVIDKAYPALEKAVRQPLTDDDVDLWMTSISKEIPEGSPGKQVTMNVNAAGKLVKAMSQFAGDTNRTVIDLIHEGMSDPNVPAADIRELFMSATKGAGIDNKVLSFILLVGGKDDVLVMDRIQGRHLWDDGRYGGANIYDGIGPNKEGLSAIVRGPRGNLITRILEDGMRRNVNRAYEMVGRPQDASLGRWHWETWVIEGEQVVNHGTLQAVINGSPIGTSVTEGKTDTFSSGMTYIRGENAPVVEYPLSDGTSVYMSPTRMKEFESYIKNSKNGIVPKGFKVTARADIPWYTRPEVNREKLDQAAREFENAKPNGSILRRDERSGENKDASRRGNSPIDKRYSLGFISQPSRNVTQRDGRMVAGRVDFRGRELKPVAQYGDDSRPVYEIADPAVFTEMIQAAKRDLGPLGPQVTDYTEMGDSYSGKRLFLFDDGYSGFALNGNDIISVFSVPGPAPKGAVKTLMPIAVEQGGERLDAFNTFLPYVYSKSGFRAVAKLPFNREYAPEGWNYSYYAQSFPETNGEPEVVFMVYDPDNASKDTTVLIDDYDVGSELQSEALQQRGRDESSIEPSAQDELPDEVRQDILEAISEEDIVETKRFSVAPSDPNQIIAAPVKNKDGTTSPIYGSIMDRGNLVPVILKAGNHRDLDDGTALGAGLFHIQQRGHDRELMRFSKYRSATQAIYDTLRKYKDQGYDDGPDLTATPQGRDRLVLEWRNNVPYSAPPLNLVLEKKPLGRGSVYEVVTFYPDLQKKDRAVVDGRTRYSVAPASTEATQLATDVKDREYNLSYAKAADFLAKGLGFVMPSDVAQEKADSILRKFQDAFLPVGRMIQELNQAGLKITDAMDTYLKEELFHRKTANEIEKRQNTLYKDVTDAGEKLNISEADVDALKRVSLFFKQSLEAGKSVRQSAIDAYLYASHAEERNSYIQANRDVNNATGSGMSSTEASDILNWFSNLDSDNVAAISDLDAAVKAIIADTNKVRVDTGLIPREFVEIEDEDGNVVPVANYQNYVPLRGMFDPEGDEDLGPRPSAGSGFAVRGREDRKARGRTQQSGYAQDILANVLFQNQNAVIRGEKNLVGQSFLELMRGDEETGTSLTQNYGRILKTLPQSRVSGVKDGQPVMRFRANIQKAINDPNIFVAKENGKDVFVEIYDDRIAKALKGDTGLGASSFDTVLRYMGKINRYLSNINTSYNPEFLITNMVRDLQTAGVNVNQFDEKGLTSSIMKGLPSALGGIKRAIRDGDVDSEWSKIYLDFVNAGGKNATNQMNTVADQAASLESLLNGIATDGAKGKIGLMGSKFMKLAKFMEDYNTVVENGIRVSTYQSLLDKGFSRERAAQAAGNVTVNFSKGGEYKTFMNSMYLFYNAALQGSFALLNAALRSNKVRRLWMGIAAMGVIQDQLNAAISDEDEDGLLQYDKIPDYIKEHNFILMDPMNLFSDRGYFALPMPYGLNMAHNLGRASSSVLRGQDIGDAANSIVGTTVDTLSPIGGIWSEGFLDAVFPTVADPIIDIYKNEDFAGRPIYKQGFPGDRTPESQMYWSTTSPVAKWVSSRLNALTGGTEANDGLVDISPDKFEYWFDFLTGGVGRFALRTAELPVRVYEEGLTEDLLGEVPLARKVIGSVTDRQDLGTYIEKRDRVLRAFDEIKDASEKQDAERLAKARRKYSNEIKYIALVRRIESARRQLARQINLVRDNERLSDERKQELLDQLEEKRNQIVLRATKLMKDFE